VKKFLARVVYNLPQTRCAELANIRSRWIEYEPAAGGQAHMQRIRVVDDQCDDARVDLAGTTARRCNNRAEGSVRIPGEQLIARQCRREELTAVVARDDRQKTHVRIGMRTVARPRDDDAGRHGNDLARKSACPEINRLRRPTLARHGAGLLRGVHDEDRSLRAFNAALSASGQATTQQQHPRQAAADEIS
jgi:hypothetical protein